MFDISHVIDIRFYYDANKFVRAIKRDYFIDNLRSAIDIFYRSFLSFSLSLMERKIIESSNGDRLKK